jgi:hypothetical protein
MINDSLMAVAMGYGKDLADDCAHVNWKKLKEADEKFAEEVAAKLAKHLADLRVERRSQSYDYESFHARGAEGLRAIVSECGGEPELINTMVEYTELAFQARLEEARVGRRKMESLLRKTRLGGHAHAATAIRSKTQSTAQRRTGMGLASGRFTFPLKLA